MCNAVAATTDARLRRGTGFDALPMREEVRHELGAALDTLVRSWANETVSTKLRINLFNPGPIRTRLRASVFPGEDPMTLDTPEQAAEFIVPMCAPDWTETGKFYDYPTRTLLDFRAPA